MKIKSILLVSFLSLIILTSCATTGNTGPKENPDVSNNTREITRTTQDSKTKKEETQFLESIQNISINFTKKPKTANINKAFSNPYVIEIKNSDGTAIPNFKIVITYPTEKTSDGSINFTELEAVTDENGIYSFEAPTPTFAVDTKVSVYPKPFNENVEKEAKKFTQTAEWKVKSDIISKGAVLFIWDFNEKDRPVNNSYEILSEFRTRGMAMVGNAPINEPSYIGKPIDKLYKDNYEIIEDSYGYLIVGTIKFTKPVEQVENGYLCSLIADIQAINMKTGKEIFASTFFNEATGANWTKCVNACKEKLAETIVDSLVYGL